MKLLTNIKSKWLNYKIKKFCMFECRVDVTNDENKLKYSLNRMQFFPNNFVTFQRLY